MIYIFNASAFILGLIVGSFLNVVVSRYGTGISFFKGRSMCFSCGKTLSWRELIPILSFLFQGGRCKFCGSKISLEYLVVELTTGLLFLLLFLKIAPAFLYDWFDFLFYLVIFSLLIALCSYDIRHKIIPDEFSFGFALLAVAYYVTNNFGDFSLSHLLAGPVLALCFYLLWVITRGRGMGLGDAKLALGIGWLLGLSQGISAVLLAFWIGAVVSILILIIQRLRKARGLTMKSEVPFGPYLVLGTLLSFLLDINLGTISGWLSFGI